METVGIFPVEKVNLANILKEQIINHKDRTDKIIWEASEDGNYKVKVGYNIIINSNRWDNLKFPLDLCWDAAYLPKAGIFLFEASENWILTADYFTKNGFLLIFHCNFLLLTFLFTFAFSFLFYFFVVEFFSKINEHPPRHPISLAPPL